MYPTSIEALLVCRLISLDKNPSLRPAGVVQFLRIIIGKVRVSTIKEEVISSVGSLQVCAGHEAGWEAAIHAMYSIFKNENTVTVPLIDAENSIDAFNSVNRETFVHIVKIICPAFVTFVSNCYSSLSRLCIIGGSELKSTERTT